MILKSWSLSDWHPERSGSLPVRIGIANDWWHPIATVTLYGSWTNPKVANFSRAASIQRSAFNVQRSPFVEKSEICQCYRTPLITFTAGWGDLEQQVFNAISWHWTVLRWFNGSLCRYQSHLPAVLNRSGYLVLPSEWFAFFDISLCIRNINAVLL